MLVRVLTLRFDAALEAFDEAPLQEFIKDKAVLSMRDHFFVKHETPYLAMVVTYEPSRSGSGPVSAAPRVTPDTSWRALVTEDELPLFNTLRDWRTERSKQEGVPPYVLCTNRQLAAIVKARPQSLTRLGDIDGFGKAKLDKYGADLLAILARAPARAPAPPPVVTPTPPPDPLTPGNDNGHPAAG